MMLYQNTVPIEQQSLTKSLNVSYTPRPLHHGRTQAISVTSETTICHLYVYLCNWFTCQIHALHEARFPPLQCIHKVCATLHLVQQAIHYTEWFTSNERKAYSLHLNIIISRIFYDSYARISFCYVFGTYQFYPYCYQSGLIDHMILFRTYNTTAMAKHHTIVSIQYRLTESC